MATPFREIFMQATEMFDLAARTAEAEAESETCDEVVLESLIALAESCKALLVTAKIRSGFETALRGKFREGSGKQEDYESAKKIATSMARNAVQYEAMIGDAAKYVGI